MVVPIKRAISCRCASMRCAPFHSAAAPCPTEHNADTFGAPTAQGSPHSCRPVPSRSGSSLEAALESTTCRSDLRRPSSEACAAGRTESDTRCSRSTSTVMVAGGEQICPKQPWPGLLRTDLFPTSDHHGRCRSAAPCIALGSARCAGLGRRSPQIGSTRRALQSGLQRRARP